MQVGGHITLGVAFGDMGLDAAAFPKVADAVRSITETFLADFPETQFIDE